MPLKFRLKGLAETFVDALSCPHCRHDGGETGDDGFRTDLSRVTYDGIVVVIQCDHCAHIFVPDGQRFGILNSQKLRRAVEKDSQQSGDPILQTVKEVRLEIERMNAQKISGGAH